MENNRKLNRLQFETSPYLIQHAGNPVDWFPWGEEALKKAIVEDKLILVSIGYAACHWCHVMEHQSFEDESVAQLMNENFVCVKVDREERPDLDQVYMNAVQLITGGGGWPLNCFALPDGSPVYAGTYFPKDDWINVLKTLAGYWQTEKTKLVEHAVQIKTGMLGSDTIYTRANELSIEQSLLDEAVLSWKDSFDWEFGGENRAPKFPMPNNYDFLLAYAGFKNDKNVDDYVKLTLNKIADGGINDHVGGGFARYSVDKFWKVPHFEKMLYDNAQLISLYSNAYKKFNSSIYKKVIEKTILFVSQEMSSPEGGFYSSYDADSEGVEGKYYVWSYAELENILKDRIHIYKEYYSITEDGNWEQNNNILFISKDKEAIAKANNLTPDELENEIEKANKILYTERKKRVAPLLDDKILTSWNALMITGFIEAYKALQVKDYLSKAMRNAGFIVDNLMDSDGKLFRNYKNGVKSINAFLDDYSFTAKAFIQLFEVTGDLHWIQRAEQLVIYSIKHFYDEKSGMFFYTSDLDAPLVVRKMEIADNVIPSSNSEMAKNLYLLSIFLNKEEFKKAANQMLANVKDNVVKYNRYYSNWALLALWFDNPFYEVIVVGEDAEKTVQQINLHYLPNCVVTYSVEESDFLLFKGRFVKGKTLIYVCKDNTCKMPVETIDEALKLIAG